MTLDHFKESLDAASKICWILGADLTIWLRMNRRLAEDPSLGAPGDFMEFIHRVTFDSAAVRLRSLLSEDNHKRTRWGTASVATPIKAIADGAIVFRRRDYVACWDQSMQDVAEEFFSEMCGSSTANEFPPAVAANDLARCLRIVKSINVYANDAVAHPKFAVQLLVPAYYTYMRAWSWARRMIYKYEHLSTGSSTHFNPDLWLSMNWEESLNKVWFPRRRL